MDNSYIVLNIAWANKLMDNSYIFLNIALASKLMDNSLFSQYCMGQ